MHKYVKHIACFCIFSFALFAQALFGQSREYLLKSAFIVKFTKYTEWPDNSNKSFNIIVYGPNEIVKEYQEIFANMEIKNKPVTVKGYNSFRSDTSANIIYISDNQKNLLKKVYPSYKNKPVLIICESPGMAKKGAHINFYLTQDETLHFEINEESVNLSNLKMNFRLLEIAKIISPTKE